MSFPSERPGHETTLCSCVWEALARPVVTKGCVNWHLVAPKWQMWLYRNEQVVRLEAGTAAGSTLSVSTPIQQKAPQFSCTLHMEMLFPLNCMKTPVIHSCSFSLRQAWFYPPLLHSPLFILLQALQIYSSQKKWFFCCSLDLSSFYILSVSRMWGSGGKEALLNSRVHKGI